MPQTGPMPACLQHLELTLNIGGDIGMRVDERMAHAGLGREMDDPIDLGMTVEQGAERPTLRKLEAMEGKALLRGQSRKSRFLERDGVIVVQIVDTDHLFTAPEQRRAGVHTDESGG